ncbi:unnamed protein product [Kuraishia capsulata CBS 1993]|uniref:DAGKc domain-containing protein n=1 Tax=Kuraishia capsulata CBS 1993 TaxID=1382522 RepID=W6MSN5_9ASCO|nr:uncharacterized protein KUCA_T00004219001 [Kuraishia capsulata CBS 1993]CDK28237.1 unnamed protein product [Kuraishia capsulata CBS 1993]
MVKVLRITGDVDVDITDDERSLGVSFTELNGVEYDDLTECNKESLPYYLSHDKSKIYVIDSIMSGSGRTDSRDPYPLILKPIFARLGVIHEYIKLGDSQASSKLCHQFPGDVPLTLIFLSGDTTLSEFINSLSGISGSGRDVTLLPIPMGTGNAYSHSVGIHNVADAVKALFGAQVNPFNCYSAKFSEGTHLPTGGDVDEMLFFVVASWGLHASLVADSDSPELRQFGIQRFKMAFEDLMKENPSFHGQLGILHDEVEEFLSDDTLSYFVIAAVPRFEEKFCISPKSDPKYSTLYVISFDYQVNTENSMKIMGEAYNNGAHIENPLVRYLEVKAPKTIALKVKESNERLSRICIDGKIVVLGGDKTLRVKSVGSSVNGWKISCVAL